MKTKRAAFAGPADVLLSMLESGVRHVPVVDARRRLLGVVSDVDLVGLGWRSPLQLRSRIESATDVPGVAAAGLDLPRIVAGLVDEGADPIDVAGMVTLVIDALSQRFIELAVERLGAPPVPWAWMMLGSAARREQAAITDQDHALAFELNGEPLEEVDGYFLELATAVTSGLEAAGIPRCHADVVAENRSLRRPLDHWVAAFNGWMDDPGSSREGRLRSCSIDGGRPGPSRPSGHWVRSSAPPRPNLGSPRGSRSRYRCPRAPDPRSDVPLRCPAEGEWTFDVKREGLTPIVSLARSYTLEAGVTEAGTLRRLSGAALRGRIAEQSRGDLTEAFRLMWRIRLEHHARCVEDDHPLDDLIEGRSVGSLSRAHPAEALKIIRHEQRSLRHRRAKT
jgi:CBS domain-containing protein